MNGPNIEYFYKKFPALAFNAAGDPIYYWQSAFIDAYDHNFILYAQVWEQLRNYDTKSGRYLMKYYNSADTAMRDMLDRAREALVDWDAATKRLR